MSGEEFFLSNLGTKGMPCQNWSEEREDVFLIACTEMLSHKRLRWERILSPNSGQFYPITETSNVLTEKEAQKILIVKQVKKEDIAVTLWVLVEEIVLKEERRNKESE